MDKCTIKQVIAFIKTEIGTLYPDQEVDAMIYQILRHTLNLSRTDIYLNNGTNVPKTQLFEIEKITIALKKYEPLQYILGETSFYGLTFLVNQHVLIPRPETEELVEWILKENNSNEKTVIDLGTGSGCIPVALAKERPLWKVQAADISADAIQMAQQNAELNNAKVEFLSEDMLAFSQNLMAREFDIIVSNPPYVMFEQKAEMLPNVLNYEPHIALFAPGSDPLIFYRKIAAFAATNLSKGGKVYVEINESLPQETSGIFREIGMETILKKDINDKFRMLKAFKND